jgi:alpha-N-arabinofuranosidase
MASYAPLLGHVDGWQWRPNLIWFDNLRVFGTPNYYVQQLFSRNRGTTILPVQWGGLPSGDNKTRAYASATRDQGGEIIVKVVNATAEPLPVQMRIKGIGVAAGTATVLAGNLADENSLDEPQKVAPVSQPLSGLQPEFGYSFKPYSLTVLRLPAK